MQTSPKALAVLRLVPEPLKRRLRPILLRALRLFATLPGALLLARVARRFAPGTYGWLHRRYVHYAGTAAILKDTTIIASEKSSLSPDLSEHEKLIYIRLRQIRPKLAP
jgi:hypothetical protein